ncbi:MAG: fumarylacetoacetate hydrolase family protein [Firmicutes bacterium]|uniref:FAA hydrolase family protein n=1 Tax=Sulfobacillus benefaciens TaxID=453960 RepID=A0A2T2X924_9FIRM|nr:fumarylacetoacetate hydrolase family protein [Bacillota bacterium]PSR30992.1 MAG: FAA hydrolase family protein [Sulfobacillus benefaciens]
MKLCQFTRDGIPGTGLYHNEHSLWDVSSMLPPGISLVDCLMESYWRQQLEHIVTSEAAKLIALSDIRWMLPCAHPGKIIGLGLNYHRHVHETPYQPPKYPVYFLRLPHTLVAHSEPLKIPAGENTLDFEGELAIVIGRHLYQETGDGLVTAIAGYSIFNDASVRSLQFRGPEWTLGKNCRATGAFGPWLVSRDELVMSEHGICALNLTTRVNGVILQQASTEDLIFSILDILRDLNQFIPLDPGDIILTGTPEGVGFTRIPPLYLKPGDVVEISLQNAGTLVNPVEGTNL